MIVKLRKQADLGIDQLVVPIASTSEIAIGNLVSYSGGEATKVTSATNDATFLGVSLDTKEAANTSIREIAVAMKCVVSAPVTSGAYKVGDGLKYDASNKVLTPSSGADTIAWAHEDTRGGSVTELKVLIDSRALGKLFTTNA